METQSIPLTERFRFIVPEDKCFRRYTAEVPQAGEGEMLLQAL